MNLSRLLSLALLLGSLYVLVSLSPVLLGAVGQSDFRFNWIASYLLAHGENMYAPEQVMQVQRSLTGAMVDYPLITLSPPWVALLLLPYAAFAFADASRLWFLTNIVLIVVSAILLWRDSACAGPGPRSQWISLVAAFSFSITLTTLVIGQTTPFVLAMVAVFLYCEKRGWDARAGVALAGMAVKPQMVFVTMLLLGLFILHTRRWRMVLGFVGTMLAAVVTLFALRPTWFIEYQQALTGLNALAWQSSNLAGLLLVMTGQMGGKLIGIAILPLVVLAWWRWGRLVNLRVLIDLSVLLSVLTAPYGFSYDQVILLVPLSSILAWIAMGELGRIQSIMLLTVLTLANVASYYTRMRASNEVYFVWVPVCVAVVYVHSLWRVSLRNNGILRSGDSLRSGAGI